jgi:hypothetical protein
MFMYMHLKLKQFVFSNEVIQTGNSEIDEQIRDHYAKTKITLSTGSGQYIPDEIVYQGTDLANATAQAIVYDSDTLTQTSKYINVYRVFGKFSTGPLIGASSNTLYQATVVSVLFQWTIRLKILWIIIAYKKKQWTLLIGLNKIHLGNLNVK